MLLAVEASAVTASAALAEGTKIIKSEFINAGLTHSETLLPMIKRVMDGIPFGELESIAVTVGPGSFTGVRIGVATVKGLAFCDHVPCVAVSTPEAIAYNFVDKNCIVCSVMDARRMQFYNAVFSIENGVVKRLCPDRAISIEDLRKELSGYDNVIIAGDGAELCFDNLGLKNVVKADDDRIFQNAAGVALAAVGRKRIPAEELMPFYLRPSQAERELKLKRNAE